MSKKYIKNVIKDEYLKWNKGDLILITAGTGTGKSTFVKEELNTYCIKNKKNILYLTNRDTLKEQVKKDVGKCSVTVLNYQKVEAFILNNIQFSNYDYVVMDESHYFFTDASFNRKTDLFFKRMLNDNSICKILMTATPTILLYYFKKYEIKINYHYELPTDYSYIDKVIAFNNYESIEKIIEDIPEDEQIMFFTNNIKKGLEICKKYNGSFICSEHREEYYNKYVKGTENEEERNSIIQNAEFKNHLLCTTTALDNGINIKEGTPVKHIIIDIFDRDEFIQCLGRKRVNETEKVNLYFNAYNDNKRINGFKSKIINSLEMADYLIENGELEYTKKKFKTDIVDTRIIDEIVVDNQIHKVVNDCIYSKYYCDLVLYNSILEKKYDITYKSIIALALGIDKNSIPELEVAIDILSLEETLERIVNERLYKDIQNALIDFIGLKDARGRLQKSFSIIKTYIEENTTYTMIKCKDKRRKLEDGMDNPNRDKIYWQIIKTEIKN